MPAAKWKKLGKGIYAVKLWNTIGPKFPQIVALRLSREEYKEFLNNPKSYLNGFKVFGKTPTKEVSTFQLASLKSGKPGSTYVVVTKHNWDCTSAATSSSAVKL
jgi:hypothetical protein